MLIVKSANEAQNYQAIAYIGSAKMIKSFDRAHTVHHISQHIFAVSTKVFVSPHSIESTLFNTSHDNFNGHR